MLVEGQFKAMQDTACNTSGIKCVCKRLHADLLSRPTCDPSSNVKDYLYSQEGNMRSFNEGALRHPCKAFCKMPRRVCFANLLEIVRSEDAARTRPKLCMPQVSYNPDIAGSIDITLGSWAVLLAAAGPDRRQLVRVHLTAATRASLFMSWRSCQLALATEER